MATSRAQRMAIAKGTIASYSAILQRFPSMGTTSVLHTCQEFAAPPDEVIDLCSQDDEEQDQSTAFLVCPVDTIQCARTLVQEGLNPLVLNFASDCKPGGGWMTGSPAQEEDLFYKTTYGRSLDYKFNPATKSFYPLLSTACIYSPNVYVIRDDKYTVLGFDACYPLNFVACAAIRQPRIVAGDSMCDVPEGPDVHCQCFVV